MLIKKSRIVFALLSVLLTATVFTGCKTEAQRMRK